MQDINIIELKTLQTMFNGFKYMLRLNIRNFGKISFGVIYKSYLSTQPMLIDISVAVTSTYSHGISSSYRKKYLYWCKKFKIIWQKVKSRYTYLSHDHDLVAGQVMLFDSLSENNFGMTIRICLVIIIAISIKISKRWK